MKITNRIISIFIVLLMLLNTGIAFAAEDEEEEKESYPTALGKSLGEIYGARDFHEGEKSDWKSALPKRSDVEKMFGITKQSSTYRSTFVYEFNDAFELGYIEAYDKAAFEPVKVTLEQGLIDGEEVGKVMGAAYGAKDFYEGEYSYFKRDLPSKQIITSEYTLYNDSVEYAEGFIEGYLSAYELAYNEAFRAANMSESLEKLTTEIIPISGAELSTADNRFFINVLPGTFYHDVDCIITTTYDADIKQSGGMVKASDSYNIKIVNPSGNVDESKLIEISFEYYGDKVEGGIYRSNGSGWVYVPTTVKDNMLTAKINPSILTYTNGTTFSAFADKNASVFRDARGHWASNEIDAYVRRGIISGYSDKTFRPDNNISRAEFLTLLSRVYSWNLNSIYPGNTITFKDSNTFGNYTNVIYYANRSGIIYGYSDGTFKPGNPISYAEVEIIMKRILPHFNFRWVDIANNMLYEKKVRSNSFNNINNNITRAEVVYMLYNITE